MTPLPELKAIYKKEKEEILKDYFTFLRFESIATDPAYKPQVRACADWLEKYIGKCGLKVERWETKGAPILFATYQVDPTAKTVLIYGHYDVQPVDPLDLWITPPFEPTVRDGAVYARGAVDDKGQIFYALRALKTVIEQGEVKVNIKLLIEGEEESGSHSLAAILEEKKEKLKADYSLIVDSGIMDKNQPAITVGVRGLTCMTLKVQGSKFDLHSGLHGGIVYNPNRALVEMLASLHDSEGKVTVGGFYDEVQPVNSEEKKKLDLTFNLEELENHFGAQAVGMEKGLSPLEAAWLRPTLEINGISGGYAGAGFKTVIPAVATAKISCRLVPHQDPKKITERVKAHLKKHLPPGMTLEIEESAGSAEAYRSKLDSPLIKTMEKAYSEVFNKPCATIMIGGSIPIGAALAQVSGADMAFVGVCLMQDQVHAPNEHFGLDRFEIGYLTICRGIALLV